MKRLLLGVGLALAACSPAPTPDPTPQPEPTRTRVVEGVSFVFDAAGLTVQVPSGSDVLVCRTTTHFTPKPVQVCNNMYGPETRHEPDLYDEVSDLSVTPIL
ncbi:hypothetical protein [uncultured Deinococcus sp.]|uniref:hypothetical protein n=1 Tax=uncultured Deinococcus sp. TaxID=158789 RepID=UPI0025891334|nr:hypothetical protein [uncultured Deinococcus sp.]